MQVEDVLDFLSSCSESDRKLIKKALKPRTGMEQVVSLDTLADGAVVEQFEYEMQKVLMNIADPNTDPYAVRSLLIQLNFKAQTEDRDSAKLTTSVTSKLAPQKPTTSQLFVDVRGSIASASEIVRKQTELEFSKVSSR